jgi:hypothetical protein
MNSPSRLLVLLALLLTLLFALSLTGKGQNQGDRPYGRPMEVPLAERMTSQNSGSTGASGSAQSSERVTDPRTARLYNKVAVSFERENALWLEYEESVVRCRPDRCQDLHRTTTLAEIKQELKSRLTAVEELEREPK